MRYYIITLLIVLLTSCRSTKQATHIEREETNTSEVAHHDYAAQDWQQSWRTLALELDSFELWLPAAHVDAPSGTADSTAAVSASLSTPSAWSGVLLKAKRATLATNTTATHTSAKNETFVDSIQHHRAAASDVQETSDRVAVTKPPDIPWKAIGIIVAIGAVTSFGILCWRKQ